MPSQPTTSTRASSKGPLALVACVIVVAVFVGGVAFAANPGPEKTIQACYTTADGLLGLGPSKGTLRVIDSATGDKCRANETALSWNQQGPKGDTGAPGPEGAAGPAGPAGPAGSSAAMAFHASNDFTGIGASFIEPFTEVVALNLPAGSYALTATGDALSQDFAALCELRAPEGVVDTTGPGSKAFQMITVAMSGVVSMAAPGKVSVRCKARDSMATYNMYDTHLTAIAVGAINTQTAF